jgi:hypothetical protein
MPRPTSRPLAPLPDPAPAAVDEAVTISCDDCAGHGTSACGDCVVTFLCGPPARAAVVIDVAEARAMRVLAGAGLVPGLRHVRSTG